MASFGSASPIEALYNNHHAWLLSWLRRRLGDASDAADLAHDTFVRLMVSARGAAVGEEPRAFLTHVAKGLVIDLWRRRDLERAWVDALAALPEDLAPSPEERAVLRESLQAIAQALESLPAKARTAFLLSQLDGLTYAEIALRIGMSERMVRRYMADGLRCCMRALQS